LRRFSVMPFVRRAAGGRNLAGTPFVPIRRIRRTPALSFGPPEWLPADALDDAYFRLLPSGQNTVTPEEAAVLAAVFAEDGELPARPAGTTRWSSDFRQPS
jgi:hypothetical protein